jgi:hypothetical protein
MSAKVEASARLLAAEAEYLRASGWVPLAPKEPGGPVLWQLPGAGDARGGRPMKQDSALSIQKAVDEWG